jgi:putative alpha-1,2-mannosidase
MVRFIERGLFDTFGGNAIARLDHHFQQLNAGPCSEFAFMGNEVSLKTPWMYVFARCAFENARSREEGAFRTLLQLSGRPSRQ